MARKKPRTYMQMIYGDVVSITDCRRLFGLMGHTDDAITKAYYTSVRIEREKPPGSIYMNGERVYLETICVELDTSVAKLKKAVAALESSTAQSPDI